MAKIDIRTVLRKNHDSTSVRFKDINFFTVRNSFIDQVLSVKKLSNESTYLLKIYI